MDSVCFLASSKTFIDPIVSELTSKYKVKTFYERDIKNNDNYLDMLTHMRSCDVAFFDWCDPYVIEALRGIKTARTICRLHSYEFFQGFVNQLNWNNLDKMIVVNHSLAQMLRYGFTVSDKKLSVVYHGIDLNKFQCPEKREKKNRIGVAGYVNYKKDPSFVLNCFHEIHKLCPEVEFVWAGEMQDLRYQLDFVNNMSRHAFKMQFIPWQQDMNAFLNEVDYILSGSLFESCHLSILEGMATGAIPLVRFWRGAENIYPTHALFHAPDMCGRKVAITEHDGGFGLKWHEHCLKNRKYIENNFPFEKEVDEIHQVIQEVLHG